MEEFGYVDELKKQSRWRIRRLIGHQPGGYLQVQNLISRAFFLNFPSELNHCLRFCGLQKAAQKVTNCNLLPQVVTGLIQFEFILSCSGLKVPF